MSKKLQPLRGTKDYLFEDQFQFDMVVQAAKYLASINNYNTIQTPIFENSDVFFRTLGETSDVVSKETYTFNDRDKLSITLRPEFTAGIVRAIISNGLLQNMPLKLFSYGPVFRHERPQKARQRQFNQINFEHFGCKSPLADVDIILLGREVLNNLGLAKNIKLELNTLGDAQSRASHRAKLVEFFNDNLDKLSETSKERLEKNPLRILDSKDTGDKELCKSAPTIFDNLNAESKDFFEAVKSGLDALGVEYVYNPNIVRGLDYYTHTVFEFITEDLGAQGTVLAGGRYDGLVEQMGGTATPAVGFAAGIERLMELLKLQGISPKADIAAAIVGIGDAGEVAALKLARDLREKRIDCHVDLGMKLGKKFQRADKLGARYAIVIGDEELAGGNFKLKDLESGEEKSASFDDVLAAVQNHRFGEL